MMGRPRSRSSLPNSQPQFQQHNQVAQQFQPQQFQAQQVQHQQFQPQLQPQVQPQQFQQQLFQPNQFQRMPSQNAAQFPTVCSAPQYVPRSSPSQQSPRKVIQPIVTAAPVQTIPPGGVPQGLFGTVGDSASIMLEGLIR
eukprot:CAMPEP_0194502654 /NCGR_PEP_ID=MMETSP0253-20130528/26505_1 /TAXON_ID=2966 /ORGANISM="Noctiluca scintillans" /LENGTH=139 /DNA_ID=CAMNT_0039344839 /DNA_START=60 /DNA_END=479 /DNA_ORIENTATION=+